MNWLRYSLFALALMVCASNAFAQDTIPPRDTTKVVRDTSNAAQAFAADSVRPVAQMPQPFLGPANGFSDGVWEWDRKRFQLEATTTLADLLDRIPSVLTMRAGLYVQPQAAAYVGGTANRVEVWLDGYALDPMLEGSVDLSKIELANIDNVRIERHIGRIRIYIQTLAARDNRPYSNIEAGVGQPNANLFRGLFITPKLFAGPLGVAIDRVDTNRSSEPATQIAGWVKYSYIRSRAGVEVEYRRNQTSRDPESPWPDEYVRHDIMVRGRAQIAKGLVAEAFGGRTTLELDSTRARVDSIPHVKAEDTQLGGRLSFESPLFWANGALRLRNNEALPATQIDGAAGVRYNIFSARADVTQSDWRSAGSASEITLHAQAGPIRGLRIFGETTSSARGASYLLRLPDTAVITTYKGYRAGAELTFHGITAGAALLHVQSDDSIPTFGLPFDTIRPRYAGPKSTGWEVSGRIPLPKLPGFAIEGMLTNWNAVSSIYLPTRQYRAGLEYYATPLKSGNLEMLGRIEVVHRGPMFVPHIGTGAADEPVTFTTTPDVDSYDAYVQIRIIDVRVFMRYEDLSGQRVPQVLGRPLPGPRIFYGVKWQFFN